MGQPNVGQALQLMSVLANNTDWSQFSAESLQTIINRPQESGAQFTTFLKNGARVIIGEPKVIPIDRSTAFNPAEFIGKGWTIEEQDERSLALTEVDLTVIRFETMLKDGETRINGEEKLRRLKKAGHIRLDAKVFQTLWENQHLIPERWKEKTNNNTTYIFFDGSVLRSPDGDRGVLCLCWDGVGWDWDYDWLGIDWDTDYPSAVLASI